MGFKFPNSAPFNLLVNVTAQTQLTQTSNLSLEVYSDSTYLMSKIIYIFSMILSILSLISFLIGYKTGKIIGLELVTIFQVTFLSLTGLSNISPSFSSLSGLSFSCGFNINLSKSTFSSRQFVPLNLSLSFLNNFNITAIVIIVPLIISLVVFLVNKFKYDSTND